MENVNCLKFINGNVPLDIEIEQRVLGALLIESDSVHEVVGLLNTECFYKLIHQIIYTKILELYESGEIIDLLTVSNALKSDEIFAKEGGTYYLSQLTTKVAGAVHIQRHCLLLKQMYISRKMAELGRELQKRVYEQEDILDLLSFLNGNVDKINDLTTWDNTSKHIGVVVKKSLEEVNKRQQAGESGKSSLIKTGLTSLDRLIGGWKKGELVILAARPSMGKTALMLHFAKVAAKARYHVCLYSLEMRDVSLADRLCLSECDVNSEHFRDGRLTDEEYKQLNSAAGKIEKLPIYIDDNSKVSMRYIRQDALKKARKGKCDMIMVDYLQLIDGCGTKSNSNREREVAEVSRQAKIIAKELNVPFILLSQLNRDLEKRPNKKPILADLRDSGSIEQDADLVCFVYRPAYYGENTLMHKGVDVSTKGLGFICVGKQRNGKLGNTPFRHNPAMTQISDCVSYDGA